MTACFMVLVSYSHSLSLSMTCLCILIIIDILSQIPHLVQLNNQLATQLLSINKLKTYMNLEREQRQDGLKKDDELKIELGSI